jgi:hypothetical protein
MNAHALTYPSIQRRLQTHRRARALFLIRTTQQVRTHAKDASIAVELARAALAVSALAAWCASLLLIAG